MNIVERNKARTQRAIDLQHQVEALRKELMAVLDVAIARGEALGFDNDEDYQRRVRELHNEA